MSMWLTMIRTTSGPPDGSTPFPQYAEESPSTLTTPMFVKLINYIWYSVCVSGHYSLTSLPKPVCQGSYDDSEGLHRNHARDRDDCLGGMQPTAMPLIVSSGRQTRKICEEGKFGNQKGANSRNTFPTILWIIPQQSWLKTNSTLEFLKDFGHLISTHILWLPGYENGW